MDTNTTRNRALCILTMLTALAVNGCSQKPSNEEIAAQVKAALAEERAKEQAAAPAPAGAPAAIASSPKQTPKSRSVTHAKPVQAAPPPPPPANVCANCGVVIAVKEVEQAGKGSGLGVIAGGVTGGVVGNQVGQGTGRDLATIAGVVGGAIAGNKIEENVKKTRVYDVTIRLENGEERVLRYKAAPGLMAGDKVRLENGQAVRQ